VNGIGGKLDDYRAVAPRGSVDFMLRIAERLQGRHIVQVSVSRYGGVAAEILNGIVPILNNLGIETAWEIMLGSTDFDAIVMAVSMGLEGVEQVFQAMLARLHAVRRKRAAAPLDADLVIVHDAATLLLVEGRRRPGAGYGGITGISPPAAAGLERSAVRRPYDGAVFSTKFAAPLSTLRFVIAPDRSLSERNREMRAASRSGIWAFGSPDR
jgi:trehalose synthase